MTKGMRHLPSPNKNFEHSVLEIFTIHRRLPCTTGGNIAFNIMVNQETILVIHYTLVSHGTF